jgi:hypothetical protein
MYEKNKNEKFVNYNKWILCIINLEIEILTPNINNLKMIIIIYKT